MLKEILLLKLSLLLSLFKWRLVDKIRNCLWWIFSRSGGSVGNRSVLSFKEVVVICPWHPTFLLCHRKHFSRDRMITHTFPQTVTRRSIKISDSASVIPGWLAYETYKKCFTKFFGGSRVSEPINSGNINHREWEVIKEMFIWVARMYYMISWKISSQIISWVLNNSKE